MNFVFYSEAITRGYSLANEEKNQENESNIND